MENEVGELGTGVRNIERIRLENGGGSIGRE